MKVVMTLLVRDEQDIVADNIDFHLARGVDFIIAMDNRSVDRTTELLRAYERRGILEYLYQPQDDYSQCRWVTSMARLAAEKHDADWIINCDADEFWYPEGEDLKEVLASVPPCFDAVLVERTNFVPRPLRDGDFFADVMTIRDPKSVNFIGAPLPGKTCHRAYADIVVAQGNHSVSRQGVDIAVTNAPITIFHFPMRSYRQFANKIALGGAAYARNTDLHPDIGYTWRQLYAIWLNGKLEDFYRDLIAEADRAISDSRFIFDDRVKTALATLRAQRHCA